MNFFADRMKDFAEAARPTQVSQAVSSGNTRSGQGRGEDSPSAARDDRIAFEEFKKATGRSDTNPYGDAGLFGSGADYSNNMSQGQIDRVNRQAYNQYLGLVSGRGTQRGGEGDFIPGYAPALKLGSETPSGTVVAAPNQPEPAMGGILNFLPGVGMLQRLFGGSNTPRVLDDGGVTYSTEGIETLMSPSTAPAETSNIARSPTLISAQPRKNNKFTVPFNLDQVLRDVPKSGIGRFIEKGGFQLGPGTLKPEFNMKDKSFGLTFKMPIAANPNFSLPPNLKTETDAEFEARMDRMYGEQFERDRERMINQARRDLYLQNQPDVGVFTPPPEPRPSYKSQTLLTDRREVLPEQFGGFADPLVGGTLSDLLTRQTQEQRLEQSPLPNTYSPRRIAREALLSGRRFQQI
tara:strand:+ start:193 stop:1413 length:1221 start_codon:yes stop_codon:yes gene_type:complete